jgi:LacI family transcriptional regulator
MDIRTVAKRAAVSTATVSRTVNRTSTVTPALARRVWKAIRELEYYPNTQARGLVSGRSRIFGLIVSDLTNPFFPEIVQVFETCAVRQHYEILLASTMNDLEHMKSSVRRMIERRVEGVAVMTFGMEDVLLEHFKSRDVPLVFVDVTPPRPNVSCIRIDYLSGIRQAVQHLAALRHRKIAFISGPRKLKTATAREQAFLQSMKETGLRPDPYLIVEGDHTLEG